MGKNGAYEVYFLAFDAADFYLAVLRAGVEDGQGGGVWGSRLWGGVLALDGCNVLVECMCRILKIPNRML